MVDWVSFTISIFALIVSSVLGIISLRISWKNMLTQYGPYLILKENSTEPKKIIVENQGNGIAYNVMITIINDKGKSFQIFPYVTYLAINETREMDLDNALETDYFRKKKKHPEKLQIINLIAIQCRDVHNSEKRFYYGLTDLGEAFSTQKYYPLLKKRFKQEWKALRGK